MEGGEGDGELGEDWVEREISDVSSEAWRQLPTRLPLDPYSH